MRAEGLVLAGGKSRRMGGHHKGDLKYQEQSFQNHVIAELGKLTDRIFLSYGSVSHGEYPGCRIVRDTYPEIGPVGGLCAGLEHSEYEMIMVAACDMPLLNAELYRYLWERLSEKEAEREKKFDGVVPVTKGKMHPLAAIYRTSALRILEQQIEQSNYRVTDAVKAMDILYVDVTENVGYVQMLRNINTGEEYQKLVMDKD